MDAHVGMGGTGTADERLVAALQGAERVVVFTGAGISTESGIPDFRSPGGVWSRMRPIIFREFLDSEDKRREAWTRAFSGVAGWTGGRPNRGHVAVARLLASGRASAVITQNVDNLHQLAGAPDDKVIELHGNAGYARCLACEARYELAPLRARFEALAEIPNCECGGLIKVATISFGQPMPAVAMRRARQEALDCDLFLVLGSSLTVFPAAELPVIAKSAGAALVIVNRDPTPLDGLADLVFHREIGLLMEEAVSALS
jgi:NAD-dependent deacetylase